MQLPSDLQESIASGVDLRDFSPGQLDAFREELNSNFYLFCVAIFQFPDINTQLHEDLCGYIQDWGKPGYERIMTQIPREFFKTSVGTRANALWQICREPHKPVAIFNERDQNSKKWLRSIRDVVHSNRDFHLLYRHLLPPGIAHDDTRTTPRWWKWSDEALDFNGKPVGEPEASISAHGIEAATTGGHWPKLILDDLISVKHKLSEIEMERAREWVRNHVYLMTPAEKGMAYVNCTPWTFTDIYVDLARQFDYKLYRRSALEDKSGKASLAGESILPEKLSTERLLKMYRRDEYVFWSQMMCFPKPGREQHFDMAWIRNCRCLPTDDKPKIEIEVESYDAQIAAEDDGTHAPRVVPLSMCNVALFLDPAPSESRDRRSEPHARNAVIVEAIDPWGRRFILESWADRVDYMDVIHKVFELAQKWGADTLYVEEVAFSNVYRHWIAELTNPGQTYSSRYLHVCAVRPGKTNKDTRITARIPSWRSGLYYVNRTDASVLGAYWNAEFVREMSEYPNGHTCDLLDALAYDTKLISPESPYEHQQRMWHESTGNRWPYGTRDPVTGY